MDWLIVLVAMLADYRLARMVALEDGPFELFLNWRGWVFERFGNGWVNAGANCPLCLSFWIGFALAVALGFILALPLWYACLLWFALSGAASFLYLVELRYKKDMMQALGSFARVMTLRRVR